MPRRRAAFTVCATRAARPRGASFAIRILGPNCAGCHSEGTTFAKQSKLILTPDAAYGQLVNRKPANTYALEDGLELVGTEGLASVGKSFLWEKINTAEGQHFYDDHPGYGSLMPLGMDPLTDGELKFILQWILEGAPEHGTVAKVADLANLERYAPPPFTALAKPDSGIQLARWAVRCAGQFRARVFYVQGAQQQQPGVCESCPDRDEIGQPPFHRLPS